MTDRILDGVLEESKWLPASFAVCILVLVAWGLRRRRRNLPPAIEILCALNLCYGCLIGVMAIGHLLAVTIKISRGTLEGSPVLLYPLGVALALPAWWLALQAGRATRAESVSRNRVLALNAGLGIGLLVLGVHNAPLAVPAALNVLYSLPVHPALGRVVVGVAVVAYVALFIGSLVFLAHGGSFEQFQGM